MFGLEGRSWLMGQIEKLDREKSDLRQENDRLRWENKVIRWLLLSMAVLLVLALRAHPEGTLGIVHLVFAGLAHHGAPKS